MKLKIISSVVVILVLACGGGLVLYHLHNQSVLPGSIAQQVNFAVYFPDSKAYPVERNTIHFDSNSKVLGYTADTAGKKIVVNEQAEPVVFSEAGASVSLYQKLLDKMHQYQEVDSNVGIVTLTHPDELQGRQAAVMDVRGTLLFAEPNGDMTTEQWKVFFDSLRVVQ